MSICWSVSLSAPQMVHCASNSVGIMKCSQLLEEILLIRSLHHAFRAKCGMGAFQNRIQKLLGRGWRGAVACACSGLALCLVSVCLKELVEASSNLMLLASSSTMELIGLCVLSLFRILRGVFTMCCRASCIRKMPNVALFCSAMLLRIPRGRSLCGTNSVL